MNTSPILVLATVLLLGGCQTAYYSAMEKVGFHKRDIMVDRVEAARDAQKEASEQFASALERFNQLTGNQGGELEARYKALNKEYERSEKVADNVSKRVEAIEAVSGALFTEWQSELDQYSSASLRAKSAQQLSQTKRRYQQLISRMKQAESKIPPVLNVLRDQVFFLKHNLNARAIASLDTEVVSINKDVNQLVKEMQAAIKEADAFLNELGA